MPSSSAEEAIKASLSDGSGYPTSTNSSRRPFAPLLGGYPSLPRLSVWVTLPATWKVDSSGMLTGMLKRELAISAILAIAAIPAFPANAQNLRGAGSASAGRELAVTACSECHVVVPRRITRPRVGGPPDFVDIANEPSTSAAGIFIFLHSPHARMPNLILSDRESNDAIAYILSLRQQSSR